MHEDRQLRLWQAFIDAAYVTIEDHEALLQGTAEGMFPDLDRTALFCMLRHFAPRRVVEIGSGESTVVAKAALAENARSGGGLGRQGGPFAGGSFAGSVAFDIPRVVVADHLVIEPYRSDAVPDGVVILKQEVQTMQDFVVFDRLEEGDVLFIDSSHVVMPYGDTLMELVTILPRLASGTIVHIHDIFLPWDYPEGWGLKNAVYTEQWAVLLMLWGAEKEWEVLWASRFMANTHREAIFRMQNYPRSARRAGRPNGGSLWLRKLGPARRVTPRRAAAAAAAADDDDDDGIGNDGIGNDDGRVFR